MSASEFPAYDESPTAEVLQGARPSTKAELTRKEKKESDDEWPVPKEELLSGVGGVA